MYELPEPDYHVSGMDEYRDGEVTGFDSMMLRMNPAFLTAHRDYPEELLKILIQFGNVSAAMVKCAVHHGQWWVTRDPELVRHVGGLHDCELCREGTELAVAALVEHPQDPVLVGLLHWTDI